MNRQKPAIVALTGGIASGKSVASDCFSALGVPVVDTDIIARELVEPGQPLLSQVVARFGETLLSADGSLDRRALREIVFSDPQSRKDLENLLHPAIMEETRRRLAMINATYAVVVIPLLAEIGRRPWIDRVLVVDTPVIGQLERLQKRDGVDRRQAEAALASQATREQRLSIADDIIVNDGTKADLEKASEIQKHAYDRLFGS